MKQASSDFLAHIRSIDIFKQLDEPLQYELASSLEPGILVPDEYLFHQGDSGDDGLYIIIKGQLRVLVSRNDGSQQVVAQHQSGEFLGEIAMLTGGRRTASVQAVAQTEVAKISKAAFDRLVEKNPDILSQISQIVLRRLRRPQLFETLTKLFGSLDQAVFEDIQTELIWLHISRGEQLICQGALDHTLYLLVSGRLQAVVSDGNGHGQVVGEIVAGESVGEMHILDGEPRSASVYAIRDSELVKLPKEGFDRLVAKYPQMMRHITQLVIKRLRQVMQTSSTSKSNLVGDIVLVPAGPDVPLTDFTQRLAAAIEPFGSTLVLNSDSFDTYLGVPGTAQSPMDDPNDIRSAIWLSEQVRHYRFRLYQTDFSVTPWTQRCLHQADEILIVGKAEADLPISDIELEMLAKDTKWGTTRKRLVLLHPREIERPSGTSKWLESRQMHQHHHVRWDRKADFRRLARIIARRAVGLVFGSGGARGFAHVGVIRAIEELGLEVDLIGGSSFGALVGALYAMGHDYKSLYAQARQLSSPKVVSDYTMPITSFLAGRKFTNLMQRLFDDVQIEDTWREFFCITSSLTKGTQNVHSRGPLWKHIRSSCSIPLIFPPSIYNGEVLADGSMLNPIPLDVMARRCEGGPIIGVDVCENEVDLSDNYEYDSSLSGWNVLWSYLNPFKPAIKTPTLISILWRVPELESTSHLLTQFPLADLYIRPPVEHVGTMNWEAYEETIEIGYRTALPQIEAWLSKQK